jgi:hypothetical protein
MRGRFRRLQAVTSGEAPRIRKRLALAQSQSGSLRGAHELRAKKYESGTRGMRGQSEELIRRFPECN